MPGGTEAQSAKSFWQDRDLSDGILASMESPEGDKGKTLWPRGWTTLESEQLIALAFKDPNITPACKNRV